MLFPIKYHKVLVGTGVIFVLLIGQIY